MKTKKKPLLSILLASLPLFGLFSISGCDSQGVDQPSEDSSSGQTDNWNVEDDLGIHMEADGTVSVSLVTEKEEVVIPEYTSDGHHIVCFDGSASPNLKRLTLPESIVYIAPYAFTASPLLEYVNIPDGVAMIEDEMFRGCSNLKSIVIPDTVTRIWKKAFYGCSSLESVTLSNRLTWIETSAFEGCTSLKRIIFPSSIQRVDVDAFKDCTSLTYAYLNGSSSGTTYYRTFAGCTSLTNVWLGNGSMLLSDNVFSGCKSLKKLFIPTNVRMGNYALGGCEEDLFISCSAKEQPTDWSENWNPNNIEVHWGTYHYF